MDKLDHLDSKVEREAQETVDSRDSLEALDLRATLARLELPVFPELRDPSGQAGRRAILDSLENPECRELAARKVGSA